jgi:hypothetical protein
MARITIVIEDAPDSRIQIDSDYHPQRGEPCSLAQQAALEIIARTRKDYGLKDAAAAPPCPKCGDNRQVWDNQITGRLTCHRAHCHTEVNAATPITTPITTPTT